MRRPRGHLADNVELRITGKGLRARIGFITKAVAEVFFFARFLEYGFRHHLRGDAKRSPSGSFYRAPFMQPAFDEHQPAIQRGMRVAVNEAFRRVALSRPSDV